MSRVCVTGSADGLGLMVGRLLVEQGHDVTLHARSPARADDARAALPAAEAVLVGDVSTLAAMHDVADQADALGRFDAVVHNAGIGYREPARVETVDGLSALWAVNVLAPYVLTARMRRPDRLVYLSSGMHLGADADLTDLQWTDRRWNGARAYAETKLHDLLLAFGVGRHLPDVVSSAVSPGWVPTRMGGAGAPDDMDQAHRTQAWLATSDHEAARRPGTLWYHLEPTRTHPAAADTERQDALLARCRELSGVALD